MKIKDSFIKHLVVGVFMFAIFMVVATSFFSGENYIPIRKTVQTDFSDDWTLIMEGKESQINFPTFIDIGKTKNIILEKTLPSIGESCEIYEDSLVFFSNHAKVKVFIDEKEVYSYGYGNKKQPADSYFTILNQVVLGKSAAGKMLTIMLEYPAVKTYYFNNFAIVPTNGISSYYFNLKAYDLILAVAFIILSICIGLLSRLDGTRHENSNENSFTVLAGFSILCGLWALGSSQFLQFFNFGLQVSNYLEYFVFFLLVIPFLEYYNCVVEGARNYLKYVNFGIALLFCLVLTLHFIFGFQFELIVNLYVLIFLLADLFVIFLCFEDFKKKKDNISFENMIVVMGFLICLVLIFVFEKNWFYMYRLSLIRMVFFIYILALYRLQISRMRLDMQSGIEANVYKHLAFTDKLTGLRNREAFYSSLDEISKQQISVESCHLVTFNICGMKKINDSFSRLEGDKVIVDFSKMLIKVFSKKQYIYRYGGDEFIAILLEKTESQFQSILDSFEKEIEIYNKNDTNEIKIKYTTGIASSLSVLTYDVLKQLFYSADRQMGKKRLGLSEEEENGK
ncbi:MAG: GGDEF domain-containing protein [Sphaerochaetaceae bacterium]|nr:GGDEF domain-containing protein [Sphaerochaetaceae bacterium]